MLDVNYFDELRIALATADQIRNCDDPIESLAISRNIKEFVAIIHECMSHLLQRRAWLKQRLRHRLPFLPQQAPSPRTIPASVTTIDVTR